MAHHEIKPDNPATVIIHILELTQKPGRSWIQRTQYSIRVLLGEDE
jgi:hypothetical protein